MNWFEKPTYYIDPNDGLLKLKFEKPEEQEKESDETN